ncbi:MAG: hypothetical protein AAFQ82_23080, partial [Myxococcota bacterium]
MRVVLAGTAPSTGRRSEELSEIERRASAEDPKSRYPGADRMGDDLLAFANQRPVAAVGGGAFYRLRCFGRRRWGGLLAGGLILALALSAAAYQVHQNEQLEQRNAANEAMLAYLEELLERDDPKSAGSSERPLGSLLDDAALELTYRLSKHPEARARVLNALGRIHQARTELTVAEQRFSAAIFVAREHDLSDALEEALEGLAVVGSWSGSYERSEELLRELLSVRQGKKSPPSLLDKTRLELADLLHSRGKYGDALEFAHAAHDSGSDKGWSGRVLGMIYRDLGELETAQHHFDDAYVFERAQEPVVETRVAELSDHRVILAAHQGDMEAARDALSESDRLRRGYLGEDWDGMVWHRHWTGLLAIATGDGKSAAGLLDRMLTDYVRFIGETSHLLAFARSDRGWTALIQGDIEYARELFSLARTRLESMQEGPHPRLAEVLLGQSLIALTDGEQGIARQLSE